MTAQSHSFAIVPSVQVPRSKFPIRQTRKMGFDASDLVPIFCEEVLPGDTWQHNEAIAARFATPIAPLIDDIDLETFYFFVNNRILWPEWEAFITGTNTALVFPHCRPVHLTPSLGYSVIPGGFFDHLGVLPQPTTTDFGVAVLPVLAYFRIWNEWFRDQNLQAPWTWGTTWTDTWGTDHITQTGGAGDWNQQLLRVNKRSDYFTRALPWPQKGAAVSLPLGTYAPVVPANLGIPTFNFLGTATNVGLTANGTASVSVTSGVGGAVAFGAGWVDTALRTDLAAATAATINSLRLASTIQRLLERDARGGSRYIENLLSHWGVRASNYMLQRPEYIGGGKYPVSVNPIAQTAAYDAEPTPTDASALGNLGAEMHANGTNRSFTFAAEEHGYIIGLACVRATPTYQQGTRRHLRRRTRLDFWDPLFAELGEQDVATQEIFEPGNNLPANTTWGYQERGAEYRYIPNEITGPLRSTAAQPMDWWHLSEEFGAEPALNANFITDKTKETLARSLATAPSEQWACQIIMDINHGGQVARLMPAYSVPGISHF